MKKMTPSSRKVALDAITAMYAIIKDLQQFDSARHQSVEAAIETAYRTVSTVVDTQGSLIIGRMEDELIVQGEAIRESAQKIPVLEEFRSFLSRVGLMSIGFEKGFSMREFLLFLKRAARQPEVLAHDGGNLDGVTL